MKLFWQTRHERLEMRAESADDLNMLADLLDHGPNTGPLAGQAWLKCPVADVPFACAADDGITTFMGETSKVVGLVWDVRAHNHALLRAQAGDEAVSALLEATLALRKVFSLCQRNAADDFPATTFTAADPLPEPQPAALPTIGQHLPELKGWYAGIAGDIEGGAPGHLVLLEVNTNERMNWAAAIKWAKAQGDGARLPNQLEGMLLYANLKDKFEPHWYWLSTQYSDLSAFGQTFGNGGQDSYGKTYDARVRAVRRLPLQYFDTLSGVAA